MRLKILSKRAFAGAVAANDAENLALLDLKAHILERPEFLDLVPLHDLAATNDIGRLARKIADLAPDDVAQRRVLVSVRCRGEPVPDQIAFGQIFDDDRVFRHGYQFALKSGPRSFFPSFGTDALRTTGKKQSRQRWPTDPAGTVRFVREVCTTGTRRSHPPLD